MREMFSDEIRERAFYRQNGRCGLCGKQLVLVNYMKGHRGAYNAHHVNGNNEDHRLSNCVCLCINEPDSCHLEAHCGDFNGDKVLAKTWFVYWDG